VAQIKIKCPNPDCGKTLIVDSDMAGKKGKCSTCDAIFLIPGTPNPDAKPSGSAVNLAATKSGELSDETRKGSTSGTQKAPKNSPTKKSTEKFLDDYVEKSNPKKDRPKRGSDEYVVEEVDYVDYSDSEDRPRRARPERRPTNRRDDDYEDYEDYDDYEAPRGRRRRDDDYEEEYEDPYDDGYGETVRTGGRRRQRSGPNIGLIRAGFMVMGIAGCVICGAIGIKILVELIGQLGSDMGTTGQSIWKIAEVLWLGASVAIIVGYSFLLFFPNKNSSLGLTIAALVLGSINLILEIVFKIIPLFSNDLLSLGGGRIETLLKYGLIEALFIAELVLIALAMLAINKHLKDRFNLQSAKRMIIPAGIYGGIIIVIGMFHLIISESKPGLDARKIWDWVLYIIRLGSQGMLIWYFVSYILLMFNTRSAMPKS
jgi:hypothetical protein